VLARDRLEQLEVRSFEVEHVGALWRMRSSAICGVVGRRTTGHPAASGGSRLWWTTPARRITLIL